GTISGSYSAELEVVRVIWRTFSGGSWDCRAVFRESNLPMPIRSRAVRLPVRILRIFTWRRTENCWDDCRSRCPWFETHSRCLYRKTILPCWGKDSKHKGKTVRQQLSGVAETGV